MKRILIITDLSDEVVHAIQYGDILAKKFGSTLFLCHVIELPKTIFCDFQWNPISYLERTISDSKKLLQDIIDRNNILTEPIIRAGCIENEIPSVIRERLIDFAIISHKRTLGSKIFMRKGNLGNLIKSIWCPILILPKEINTQGAH
jgi:hypothetical protein